MVIAAPKVQWWGMTRRMTVSLSVIGAIVAVLVAGGWLWWARVYQNPRHVFADMLRNTLSTAGVTKVLSDSSGGTTLRQYTQMNFTVQPTIHTLTVFSGAAGSVATEEISTPDQDLVRYQRIQVAQKKLDTSKVVGQWARLEPGDTLAGVVSAQAFTQALSGVVPFGNLEPEARNQLLDYISRGDVYVVDYAHTKRATVGGQAAVQFPVSIQPVAYVAMMQRFGSDLHTSLFKGIDPNQFQGQAAVKATFTVSSISHELLAIDEPATGHQEQYEAFGVSHDLVIPRATVSVSELAQRLQALH